MAMGGPCFALLFLSLAAVTIIRVEGITAHVQARLGGGGQVMDVHCASADTDLGAQKVADGQELAWSFSPSILGNTLFYCDVQWNGSAAHFDAYDFHRDFNRCSADCIWLVAREGFYWFDSIAGFWQYQFPWSP